MGYTPGVLTGAVADLTVMLAIMAGRNGGETMDFVKEGKVGKSHYSISLPLIVTIY